jgi:hypothetical protein
MLPINRSIVQGSGIGPYLFIKYIGDLKALGDRNTIIKFADDCTLLVPESSVVTMEDEIGTLKNWSISNRLLINFSKTKEIILHKPHPCRFSLPPLIDEIERLQHAKLLGVVFSSTFNFDQHISNTIRICSQRLYLLCQLRKQGLPLECLSAVFNAIIMSKLFYCSPVWRGYLSYNNTNALQKLLKKAFSWQLCSKLYIAEDILDNYDTKLFRKMLSENHCLYQTLRLKHSPVYNLRPRGHPFEIDSYKYSFTHKCYIVRSLYNYI